MPHSTIDLGELRTDAVPRAGHGWPLWERLRRHRPPWLRLVGGALAAVLVLTLAGAGGPTLTRLRPAFQVTSSSVFMLDEQNLYVLTSGSPEESSVLTAYRLPDGKLRWQSPLPGDSRSARLRMVDDLLLITQHGLAGERISRADPDTGELVWSHQAPTFVPLEQSRLLLSLNFVDSPGLSAFDLDTGDPAWSIDRGADFPGSFASSADRFVATGTGDGTLEVYDAHTGELTATGPLPVDQVDSIHVTSSTVTLSYWGDGATTTSGYDVDTLTHRWTTSQPSTPDRMFTQLQDCGPYVCLSQGHRLQALDPENGESLWEFEVELPPDGVVGLLASAPSGPPLADRVLVTRLSSELPVSWLLDVQTGEPVLTPDDWIIDLGNAAQNRPVLGYRVISEEVPVGIGQLKPDQLGFDLLGEVDPMPQGFCQSRWPYVACGSSIGSGERTLTVWRVRT